MSGTGDKRGLRAQASLAFPSWRVMGMLSLALLAVSVDHPEQIPPSVGHPALIDSCPLHKITIQLAPADIEALRAQPRQSVRGTVDFDGALFQNVSLHLKGNVSFQPISQKPSFTLKFRTGHDLVPDSGPEKMHLNNSAEDPTFLHELLGADLFRAAGIPAPRVAHALVQLNGRKLGLYVLKEGFSREFLARAFPASSGVLYEPDSKAGQLVPRSDQNLFGNPQSNEMRLFTEWLQNRDAAAGFPLLPDCLDLDTFSKLAAMELLIVHRDGFCLAANNFRIFDDLSRRRLFIIPSGMDQLFGKVDYPLPLCGGSGLARGGFATASAAEEIHAEMRALLPLLSPSDLHQRIDLVLAALRPSLSRTQFNEMRLAADDLKERIALRYRFLQDNLGPGHEPRLIARAAINARNYEN